MIAVPDSEQADRQDFVYALAESGAARYAGKVSGLYRSADGGRSWQISGPSTENGEPIPALALVAHEQAVFAGVPGGILRSTDDGASWQFIALASPPPQVVALVISPAFANDGFIAAGTAQDGVFFSTDGGQQWTAWNFGLIDHAVYALAISPHFELDHTLFAGTESGLFQSKNGGRGWHDLPFPAEAAPVLSLAVSPAYASDGTLYAGTEDHGLYVSRDQGTSWVAIEGLADSAINMIGLTSQPAPQLWLLRDDRLLHRALDSDRWEPYLPDQEDKAATAFLVGAKTLLIGFENGIIQAEQR